MSTHLTPGQHARLAAELQLARQRIASALQAQLDGQDRVTHAQSLLGDDPRELREHEDEREVDLAQGERLRAELGAVDDALARLDRPGYGRCVDCDATIPFDRLLRLPQALRCLDCQRAAEASH